MLDEPTSAMVAGKLEQSGVKVLTGHTVVDINESSASQGIAGSVTLDDGSVLPCDLVIMAIGVQPRIELVSGTGIKVNRGIVVDSRMATSSPGIYACGDVAEAYDFVYSQNRLTPIWPNAYLGGRTAGFNMAGKPAQYPGGTAINSLKYFGLNIASAGMVNPPDNDGYEVLGESHDHTYHKVILKDGLVVGMVFAGNIEKSGIVLNLIRNKFNADDYKQALVAENFGLASLPDEIWRPQLEAPLSALSMPAATEQPEELVVGE